jgi:glycosyltransferase involved in cell wall biosynthesis
VVLQLVRLLPHLGDAAGAPLVVDFIDCLSLNARTRAALDRAWLRAALRAEARRVAAAESTMLAAARRGLVVCERDRVALAGESPSLRSKLEVAPIAMTPTARGVSPPATPTVMLTGNLGYFPNRDATRFVLEQVWPRLRSAEPRLALVVAGSRPPRRLASLLAGCGGTLVTQPDDLGAVLAQATVALAPVRCGSGVPLKVLDAWAAGVPVVASPFAAAGATGEHEQDLLVAASADEWVEQIRRVLVDPSLGRRLIDGGRARIAALAPERVYPRLAGLVTG